MTNYGVENQFQRTELMRESYQAKLGVDHPMRDDNIKTKQHITDNLLRARGFDQLFNTNFGKGTSNDELMLQAGFVTVYDCGQATYVLKI